MRPGTGACTLASAMELWSWTLRHLQEAKDAAGKPHLSRQAAGATFAMADALCWLLAAHSQILDVLELAGADQGSQREAEELAGFVRFFTDLCHVQAATAAGEVGRICTSWFSVTTSIRAGNPVAAAASRRRDRRLGGRHAGHQRGARITGDVLEADGSHANKAGPCVRFTGIYEFMRRRNKLDGCLTGARLAKDRAARDLTVVEIPASLDYPPAS